MEKFISIFFFIIIIIFTLNDSQFNIIRLLINLTIFKFIYVGCFIVSKISIY